MVQRPASVTVFAVLDIIIGVSNILSAPLLLALLTGMKPLIGTSENPSIFWMIYNNPHNKAFLMVTVASSLLLGLISLLGGVMLFSLSWWGRSFAIVASIGGILLNAFTTVWLIVRIPALSGQLGMPEGLGGLTSGLFGIAGVLSFLMWTAFHALQILFLNLRGVVTAFEQAETARTRTYMQSRIEGGR